MMTFIYNMVFLIFGVLYLPTFLKKIKLAESRRQLFLERCGIFPNQWREKFFGKKVIWIHAVSVGEVMAVRKLVNELLGRCPSFDIVLTTVTPTGQKIAKELEQERLFVCYFPFDLTFAVRNFFKLFKPRCLLLTETEIWPNLLVEAQRFHVPVGILNARLSAKSEKRYLRFLSLIRPLFKRLSFVLAQSDDDAARFIALGVEPHRIEVFGNMKFDDITLLKRDGFLAEDLKKKWQFAREDRIIVAGSTHPGEEEILMRVFCELRDQHPNLKLVLAPRHIERSELIRLMLYQYGLRVQMASGLRVQENFEVLLLNKMGILKNIYQIADIVFVGGSLVEHGGQNPIEPACFKRPIIHGPHIFNFEGIYRALDDQGGALLVRDERQLGFAMKRLLENDYEGTSLGENAWEVIGNLQGSTAKHLDWLADYLVPDQSERKEDAQIYSKLSSSFGGGD